jgi:hypothetical protein
MSSASCKDDCCGLSRTMTSHCQFVGSLWQSWVHREEVEPVALGRAQLGHLAVQQFGRRAQQLPLATATPSSPLGTMLHRRNKNSIAGHMGPPAASGVLPPLQLATVTVHAQQPAASISNAYPTFLWEDNHPTPPWRTSQPCRGRITLPCT